MAYRRRIIRRRRPRFARRRFRARLNRRTGGYRQFQPRYVSRGMRQLKFRDETTVATLGQNNMSIFAIHPAIPQGTSESTRLGNKIIIDKVMLKMHTRFYSNSVTTTNTWPTTESNIPITARVWVIYDRQPNGATATANDMFTQIGTLQTGLFNNIGNTDRFTTLYDKTVNWSQGTIPGGQWNIYLKPRLPSTYNAFVSTGTVPTDIKSGLFLMVVSVYKANQTVDATAIAYTEINARWRFHDV